MSEDKTKVLNAQEAVHQMQMQLEELQSQIASLTGAIATIEKRIAPVAPPLPDQQPHYTYYDNKPAEGGE